MVNNNNN